MDNRTLLCCNNLKNNYHDFYLNNGILTCKLGRLLDKNIFCLFVKTGCLFFDKLFLGFSHIFEV